MPGRIRPHLPRDDLARHLLSPSLGLSLRSEWGSAREKRRVAVVNAVPGLWRPRFRRRLTPVS